MEPVEVKKFTRLYSGDVAYSSGGKCFKRLTTEQPQEPPQALAAGLYDANDNLVASWDTLVNTYGMGVEKNYGASISGDGDNDFETDTTSPYYVLTNNSELSSVVKLVIDTSVTSIGDYAFCNCRRLTSIEIPDSVTSIGKNAFYGCTGLTSIEIPDSITSIGARAFCVCESLTSVAIGDSVTSIGEMAFGDCTSLTSINYRGTEEQWNAITKGIEWDEGTGNYTITYNYTGE